MGAVVLRAQICMTCGGPLPPLGRVDRRYCKSACRTLAYRVRRRVQGVTPPGPLHPEWAEPNAVVKTLLTALAQIQARVLDFAHQLEREELFARLPVRTAESKIGPIPNNSKTPARVTSESQEPEEVESDMDKEVLALQADLAQAKADVAIAAERMVAAEQQTQDLELEVSKLREELRKSTLCTDALASSESQRRRELATAQNQIPKHFDSGMEFLARNAQLKDVTEQRDRLQYELLTERQRADNLNAQLIQQSALLDERIKLSQRVRELEAILLRTNTALDESQQSQLRHAETELQLHTMRRENLMLRAEVERLRSPEDSGDDALIPLMKDRVKALDLLATYQTQAGERVTGQWLLQYTEKAILDAARLEAFQARRDFYFRSLWPSEPKPLWMVEDRLLDPESEKQLRAQQIDKLNSLIGLVTTAKRRAGEKP